MLEADEPTDECGVRVVLAYGAPRLVRPSATVRVLPSTPLEFTP
jgi:hypothetical protein